MKTKIPYHHSKNMKNRSKDNLLSTEKCLQFLKNKILKQEGLWSISKTACP
ncbi:hypothetical protein FACS189418_3290 [Clostridia bacterium]|nr:hypothetical protein FACS189418_3290 [Clostridia bacterium]